MPNDAKPPSLAATVLADTVASDGLPSAGLPASARQADADAAVLARGAPVGRYIVLEWLGSGAMGIVYAAYDPELDRRVALKLLRAESGGTDATEGRARLLREAQAIARLSHPNVVAVHDVGTVGYQVFVAMELVDGITLRAWLAERPREVDATLDAFVQAGRGLEAAHEKGLVHRDFKPDNVLVGKDGRVRVLDFGLAFAERPRSEPPPPLLASIPSAPAVNVSTVPPPPSSSGRLEISITRTGAFMGTPFFMSPEQLTGRRTDARTDQFSFCVALYDALYGVHPFASGTDFAELSHAVTAGIRRADPPGKRVPAHVRQAIDRGLRVAPADRFPSMAALLGELRPAPARSRVRTWSAVAAGVAAIVAILGMRALRPKAVGVCEGAPQMLAGAWDDARKKSAEEAFRATGKPYAADAFRTGSNVLDAYASAWAKMHTDACLATRVRGEQSDELLDLRMQCLGERRAELAAMGDLFSHADVSVVEHAAAAAQSLSTLDACANVAELRAPVRLPPDPTTREAIAALRDRLAKARALDGAGRYPAMLEEATSAARDAEHLAFRPLVAEAAVVLGRARSRVSDYKGAHDALLSGIYAAEASRYDAAAAEAWPPLVEVEAHQGDFDDAEESARHGASAVERLGGDEALTARLETASGVMEWEHGHYAAALVHHRAALASLERRLGRDNTVVAAAELQVSGTLTTLGNYEEALTGLTNALETDEKLLGPEHPAVASVLSSLSNVYEYAGQADKALQFAERALAIREGVFGPDDPSIARALLVEGNAYDDLGRFDDAAAAYRRALAIFERALPDHREVADALSNLAETLLEERAYRDALADAQRALAMREKAAGEDHAEVATSLTTVGRALCALGHCAKALELHERALVIIERAFGAEHPDVADVLLALGTDKLALHDAPAAVTLLERAHAIHEKLEVSDRERADSGFALARALWASHGDRPRALALAEQARVAYVAGGPRTKDALVEVDAWQRTHVL